MSTISLLARNCTLFTTTKVLDEDAYRKSLQRFVDFKIGPFLASGGSGEANSLSWDEVRRVYQIGVAVCRGKVPVYANMPEVRSAQEAIDFSRLAIEAGVDIDASLDRQPGEIDGLLRRAHFRHVGVHRDLAPAHCDADLVDPADLIPGQRVGLARAAARQEGTDLEVDEALERLAVGVFIQRLGRGEQGAIPGEQADRRHVRLLLERNGFNEMDPPLCGTAVIRQNSARGCHLTGCKFCSTA